MRSRWGPRRVVWTVHRWLGLASGAVVVVVALTGALYALTPEITELYLWRYARVAPLPGARPLAASALIPRAEAAAARAAGALPPGTRRWLTLRAEPDRSLVYTVAPAGAAGWYEVYVDPYRGEVLMVRDMLWDPIGILLRAHQSLLLPEPIGRRVVGLAVLVFVVSLLTGLVLWFPRRPADLLRSGALWPRLTLRLRGSAFRINYDLHRTLGGYALVVTLVIALTGLVWSFAWMDRAAYWLATGGQAAREPAGWRSHLSRGAGREAATDQAIAAATAAFGSAARFDVGLPAGPGEALSVCANPERETRYRTDCLWFDAVTGRQLGADLYRDKNAGERLQALAYDIHVGRIAGLPGRVAAFLASLVAASLPITGALVWWKRLRRRRRP